MLFSESEEYKKKEKNTLKSELLKALMEAEQKKDPKYKTELCKTFSETKQCPYGKKCRFAHGKEELLSKNKGNNYKKKECKSFSELGYCLYGSRCSFKHNEIKLQNIKLPFYYCKIFIFHDLTPLNHRLDILQKITSNYINNYYNNNYNKFNSSSTSDFSNDDENNNKYNNFNINNNFIWYKGNYCYSKIPFSNFNFEEVI